MVRMHCDLSLYCDDRDMNEKLRESVLKSQIVMRKGYPYFVSSAADGVPPMEPELLDEITDSMIRIGNFDCDLIAAPEAMGIPLAVEISRKLGIPYVVIRKKSYGLPGEVPVVQRTGYSESVMYINSIFKGDRVTIVDDVLSTGGTIAAMVEAMRDKIGCDIVDIVMVFDKNGDRSFLERRIGMSIKTLLKVTISEGRVRILD
jgi:adenine phosphoribosyltransferase